MPISELICSASIARFVLISNEQVCSNEAIFSGGCVPNWAGQCPQDEPGYSSQLVRDPNPAGRRPGPVGDWNMQGQFEMRQTNPAHRCAASLSILIMSPK